MEGDGEYINQLNILMKCYKSVLEQGGVFFEKELSRNYTLLSCLCFLHRNGRLLHNEYISGG